MTYEDSIFKTEVDPLEGALKVLDHGYVKLVDVWGSDERVVEAARMSTGKGFLGWGPKGYECPAMGCGWAGSAEELKPIRVGHPADPLLACPKCENLGVRTVPGDEKLLSYLWSHKHMTPFEMAGAVVEVQAPIFVFREWHRHRTQSYNELSSRYTPLPDVNYVPSVDRLLTNSKTNKQASAAKGAEELTDVYAAEFRRRLIDQYREQQTLYEYALARGVPKELARCHLPVGRYSRMRASANLRNWIQFLTLREDEAAQWEIRQFAFAVHLLLSRKFPRVLDLYEKDR